MGVFPGEKRYNRYARYNPWYYWIFTVTKTVTA